MAALLTVFSVLLTIAPTKTAYAGTKIFGWDITASYTSLKQKVMEKILGISFPQNIGNIDRGQNKGIGTGVDSFARLAFTQKQVNEFIKSQAVGRTFGNGITLKKGTVEFLDGNRINLAAEIATKAGSSNSVKAFAELSVIENGTALRVESLDIENAGIGTQVLKPPVLKFIESQQKELIKNYAPTDFAFIEVKSGLVTVYLNR